MDLYVRIFLKHLLPARGTPENNESIVSLKTRAYIFIRRSHDMGLLVLLVLTVSI